MSVCSFANGYQQSAARSGTRRSGEIARLLGCGPEHRDSLLHKAAEEIGDAACVFKRLALDEADEVLIVAEEVEEGADVACALITLLPRAR
jgi:hypothetical protein